MYQLIDRKPTVREAYVSRLAKAGHVTREEADGIARARRATLEAELEEAKKGDYLVMPEAMGGVWSPYRGGPEKSVPEVPTGASRDRVIEARERRANVPGGFRRRP